MADESPRDPLVSGVVGMHVVGEVARVVGPEELESAQVMKIIVAESLSDPDDRLDGHTHLAHGETVAAMFVGDIDALSVPLGIEAQWAGMVLAER
jgi:hypothetical protein